MNTLEYIADLNSKCQYVGPPVLNATVRLDLTAGAKTYDIWMILKLKNGAFVGAVQPFYVLNEGTVEEVVYPSIREFKDEDEVVINPFKDEVRSYINATHINAIRPIIVINSIDETNLFAIVTAYEVVDNTDDAGNTIAGTHTETKRYILIKDTQGDVGISEFLG